MDPVCNDYPHHHHGLSGKDASFLSHQQTVAETSRGNQFNSKDRADQDRYLAREFGAVQVSGADRATSAQKDRTDDARYVAGEFGAVRKDVCDLGRDFSAIRKDLCDVNTNVLSVEGRLKLDIERNGRSAELATEKTAAATLRAIDVASAAGILQAVKDANSAALAAAKDQAATQAAIAKCCCEQLEATRAEGQKTRDLISQIDRERLQARLAVLEATAAAA